MKIKKVFPRLVRYSLPFALVAPNFCLNAGDTFDITIDAPTPDLVIYLQAPIEVLKERITKRGNINEQYLTLDYLEKLNDAYSRFFLDYKSAPLHIINASDIDLESNESDYENLITMIMSDPKGINFVNPQPSII